MKRQYVELYKFNSYLVSEVKCIVYLYHFKRVWQGAVSVVFGPPKGIHMKWMNCFSLKKSSWGRATSFPFVEIYTHSCSRIVLISINVSRSTYLSIYIHICIPVSVSFLTYVPLSSFLSIPNYMYTYLTGTSNLTIFQLFLPYLYHDKYCDTKKEKRIHLMRKRSWK